MSERVTVIVHEIATDGLPDPDSLVGQVAFLFDGCIVSGWPLRLDDPDVRDAYDRYGWRPEEGILWEANSDVGHGRPFGGVTHWVEFPEPLWQISKHPHSKETHA